MYFQRKWADVRDDAIEALDQVGARGRYILGQEVERFEESLASWTGFAHAVGVANGTDAIEIALRAHGCKHGSKVLTTPLSAFASTLAILKLGAEPVFVDVLPHGQLDTGACVELLAQRPDIQYFLPVHLYGDSPSRSALPSSVTTIDDCAQAFGASAIGQTATVSFYPTKNLGALGDGGAILTNDEAIGSHARRLRDYGQTSKYEHVEVGYNSRLDEVHAAILNSAMLPRLADWNYRRNEIARLYCDAINSPQVTIPSQAAGHLWHLFPVLVGDRERFEAHMATQGFACGRHYPFLIPELPAMSNQRFQVIGELPNARRFAEREVSLPLDPYMSAREILAVIDAVNSF